MTELPSPEKEPESRRWIFQTVGLAFGLAVLMVVIVTVAVLALESPASRRAATAQAAPLAATAMISDAAQQQVAMDAPTATAEPTQTPIALPPTATQSPTLTLLPTATQTATPQPTATVRAARSSTTARTVTQATTVQPSVRPTQILPLDMSFYVKAYCHKSTDSMQVVDLYLTAHNGVPPYDYYNDTTLIGHDAGMIRFTMKASSGNPVPYNLLIVDSAGHRLTNVFFYKTGVTCKAKPE
jgi:hypothetical protein